MQNLDPNEVFSEHSNKYLNCSMKSKWLVLPCLQTSVCGSIRELEYKQNNLSRAKEAAAVAEQEEAQEACETEAEAVKKMCFVFEPKGCFKERQDYSLFVFSPENPYVILRTFFSDIL